MRTGTDDVQRKENPGDRLNQRDNRLDFKSGEFSVVERIFTENGSFNFTSGEKIESAEDVRRLNNHRFAAPLIKFARWPPCGRSF